MELAERAAQLPTGPGVYLFKSERGRILYVGKAQNLRTRVRQALEDVVADREVLGVPAGPHAVARAREALARLDGATICTLHSFAQRLLLSAPIEAGLPPRISVGIAPNTNPPPPTAPHLAEGALGSVEHARVAHFQRIAVLDHVPLAWRGDEILRGHPSVSKQASSRAP